MSDWKLIESAPKDGTPILLYHKNIGVVCGWWTENKSYPWAFVDGTERYEPEECGDGIPDLISYNAFHIQFGPTHWMPLPQPPVEEDDHE